MPGDEPTGKSRNNNNRNDSNQAGIMCSEQSQSRFFAFLPVHAQG